MARFSAISRDKPLRLKSARCGVRQWITACDSTRNPGYQVIAVDPHQKSIERGRMWSHEANFINSRLTGIPIRNYGYVIISEVLEHLDEPELLLREAMRYLSTDGILIVTLPNGYGEFELDRRAYRASGADTVVRWRYAGLRKNDSANYVAGSDDGSPHMQRFTL